MRISQRGVQGVDPALLHLMVACVLSRMLHWVTIALLLAAVTQQAAAQSTGTSFFGWATPYVARLHGHDLGPLALPALPVGVPAPGNDILRRDCHRVLSPAMQLAFRIFKQCSASPSGHLKAWGSTCCYYAALHVKLLRTGSRWRPVLSSISHVLRINPRPWHAAVFSLSCSTPQQGQEHKTLPANEAAAPAGNGPYIPATQDVHLGGQLLGFPHVPKLAQVVAAPRVALCIRADTSCMAVSEAQRCPVPHNLRMVSSFRQTAHCPSFFHGWWESCRSYAHVDRKSVSEV